MSKPVSCPRWLKRRTLLTFPVAFGPPKAPRSLRFRLRERELTINIHDHVAVGFVDGEYVTQAADASNTLRQLLQAARASIRKASSQSAGGSLLLDPMAKRIEGDMS